MTISSRTPEGQPHRCPVCDHALRLEPSHPPGDAPCPSCGVLLWFPSDPQHPPMLQNAARRKAAAERIARKPVSSGPGSLLDGLRELRRGIHAATSFDLRKLNPAGWLLLVLTLTAFTATVLYLELSLFREPPLVLQLFDRFVFPLAGFAAFFGAKSLLKRAGVSIIRQAR